MRQTVRWLAMTAAVFGLGLAPAGSQENLDKFDCSQIARLGLHIQENLRAGLIRIHCGVEAAGDAEELEGEGYEGFPIFSPDVLGGTDKNVITGTETSPNVTQSESFVWSEGNTIVVTINDSRTAPSCYGGGSYSTDGGVTFTRLTPSPFCSGHGTNYGDPTVVFNKALNKWYASFLATGCGGQGIGVWESTNGVSWSTGACAHNGTGDDRQSHWVDNDPASPYYGRMYISWNDFAQSGTPIRVTYSDNGTTWSAPVNATTGTTFYRNVQLTGAVGGTVYIAAMDEGGGGNASRRNAFYRSTNGGANWTQSHLGAPFGAPGDNLCGYFNAIPPIWRHMGWGQPGVGPGGVVHYAYCADSDGAGADEGDILYIRSTDNGATFSAPIKLNTDSTTRVQWMPSLAVSPNGSVLVTWFDRRNTANNDYQWYGRVSVDNGLSWQPDDTISDVIIPQPAQPDPNVQSCYAGDYNYHTATGSEALTTWTDGRVQVSGTNQQDVFFDKVVLQQGFTLSSDPASASVCAPDDAAYTLSMAALSGYSGTNVTLGATGAPPNSSTSFLPNPVTLPGSSTFTVDTTASTPDGEYALSVTGTGNDPGSTANTIQVGLFVASSAPGAPNLTGPADQALDLGSVLTFTWDAEAGASYQLQVDNHMDFSAPLIDVSGLSSGTYTNSGSPLPPSRRWYWRVIPTNICGPGSASETRTFTTVADYITDTSQPSNFIAGTTNIGNSCDDCTTTVSLPFSYSFYGTAFASVRASSNGNLQFTSNSNDWNNVCLPNAGFTDAIYPFWDDLRTDVGGAGIYTKTEGSAPNRIFVIEWRNVDLFAGGDAGTFEVLLYEGQSKLTVNYATMVNTGNSATSGIQQGTGAKFVEYSCNNAILTSNSRVDYVLLIPSAKVVTGAGGGLDRIRTFE